jgi:hypothetical protein
MGTPGCTNYPELPREMNLRSVLHSDSRDVHRRAHENNLWAELAVMRNRIPAVPHHSASAAVPAEGPLGLFPSQEQVSRQARTGLEGRFKTRRLRAAESEEGDSGEVEQSLESVSSPGRRPRRP